jgi:two-component system, cell cycle response regulator DivK
MSALPGRTVLVADDNADQRALYVAILSHAGFSVIEARDGVEAIARAREDRPALIVMDVTMPGTSGWNAVRAVRDQIETRDIPVIVVTGLAGTRDRDASFAAGSDAYLSKPVSPRELLDEVRRFLG